VTKRQKEKDREHNALVVTDRICLQLQVRTGSAVPAQAESLPESYLQYIHQVSLSGKSVVETQSPRHPPASDEVHEKPSLYLSGKRTLRVYLVRVLTSVFTVLGLPFVHTGRFPKNTLEVPYHTAKIRLGTRAGHRLTGMQV
jgi:hypothetical protein